MTEEDLPAVMVVELRGYPHPWSEGIFRDCLSSRNYSCWVWELEGELLGHGVMSVAAGEAHILNLCTDPGRQGQGLGRRMLSHLLHLARRRNADVSLLEVRPSNRTAVILYESMGFNEVGRRPDYYPSEGGREDALLMARTLVGEEACPEEWFGS